MSAVNTGSQSFSHGLSLLHPLKSIGILLKSIVTGPAYAKGMADGLAGNAYRETTPIGSFLPDQSPIVHAQNEQLTQSMMNLIA